MPPRPSVCDIPKRDRVEQRCKKRASRINLERFAIDCRRQLYVEVGFILHLPSALTYSSVAFKIVG